jgi:hypothetical protein
VITRDRYDRRAGLGVNAGEEIVEKLNRFFARHRPVEEVAGDDQHVNAMFDDRCEDLVEELGLVVEEALLRQRPAQMPI